MIKFIKGYWFAPYVTAVYTYLHFFDPRAEHLFVLAYWLFIMVAGVLVTQVSLVVFYSCVYWGVALWRRTRGH